MITAIRNTDAKVRPSFGSDTASLSKKRVPSRAFLPLVNNLTEDPELIRRSFQKSKPGDTIGNCLPSESYLPSEKEINRTTAKAGLLIVGLAAASAIAITLANKLSNKS